MSPTVSVIIPAYNAERTIRETIRSCLDQTHPPLEVLVIDDGSADRTAKVVAEFPPPVRLLRKPNGGPASARNLGASVARGDWLAMLDADDRWLPTKLERQLTYDTAPDIGLIHVVVECARPGTPPFLTFDHLWDHNWISNSSVLIRRAVFEAVGGFDEDRRLISVEDYNLWLRVAAAGWRIATCYEELVLYTRGVGISSNTEKFFNAIINNILLVSERLALPAEQTRAKLAKAHSAFGEATLHKRQMSLARQNYRKALRLEPSVQNAVGFAASLLPRSALDLRRGMIDGAARLRERITEPGVVVFDQKNHAEANFAEKGPFLCVVVDTEEEFEWHAMPAQSIGVEAMRHQHKAQRIFDKFGVVPTYAVDYAVASRKEACAPLLDFLAGGTCEIGAHLHPWVNPPVVEELNDANSFPGNLPPDLEFEKLRILTEEIENNLGCRPILYRAGRYGLAPHSLQALRRLGYRVDCSVLPLFDLSRVGGPNFHRFPVKPYWTDRQRDLLEVPVTVGFVGAMSSLGRRLHPSISSPSGEAWRLPALFARLNLVNRVRLSPEGVTLAEAKQLSRALIKREDHKVFMLSYHSPSLMPGNTPYVRDEQDLARFLGWIESYIEYFVSELGGRVVTPRSLLTMAGAVAGESLPRQNPMKPLCVGTR